MARDFGGEEPNRVRDRTLGVHLSVIGGKGVRIVADGVAESLGNRHQLGAQPRRLAFGT